MDRCPFFILSLIICVAIVNGASSQNNSSIVACNYYSMGIDPIDHLTLFCNSDATRNNFFVPNERSFCQNDGNGYNKDWIAEIKFENCDQPQIPENIFEIYYNVNNLNISSLGLTTEQLEFLRHPNNLTYLNAAKNLIRSLSNGMLANSYQLTTVDFSFNHIQSFDSDAFPEGNNVTFLNLSYNNFGELAVKSFHRLKRIKHLVLSLNHITELPSFLFHKTENLIELDLSYNLINVIDDYAFAGDLDLKMLNLSHNQLTSLPKKAMDNFFTLTHLDISHNLFNRIDKKMFSKSPLLKRRLKHLNLSHNKLTEIETGSFLELKELNTIDLSENQLKALNVNIFKQPAYHLEFLNIGNNQLAELINFTKSTIPNAKIAGIDLNKINCTHFEQLFDSLEWRHFDSFSTRIQCNSNSSESTSTAI